MFVLSFFFLPPAWCDFVDGRFYVAPTIYYQSLFTDSSDLHFEGAFPGIAMGYNDYLYPYLMVGAELFGTGAPWGFNNKSQNGVSIRPKYTWGGSVSFGMPLEDSLAFYLRFGLVSSKFDRIPESQSAWSAGIGVMNDLGCNWNFRAEYNYLQYKRIHGVGAIRSHLLAVAVMYTFG
jgi:opacity protein-like surface antigen